MTGAWEKERKIGTAKCRKKGASAMLLFHIYSLIIYFLAARRISIILMALSLMTLPGPKMQAAPAWKRKS